MSSNFIAGIASGIDTAPLIEAMVASRSGPVTLIEQRQTQKQAELAAWQSFEAILISLKVETDRLGSASLWDAASVTSTDEEVATATASSSTPTGSYSFLVEQLATAEQQQSQAYSSREDLVGSGTFSVTVGNKTVDIDVGASDSLEDLVTAINAEEDLAVSASILRSEQNGVESFYLVMSADETGAASAFTVSHTLSGGTAPTMTTPTGSEGQDAIVRFGGSSLQIYSATNTFEDIVEGLDLTVTKSQELTDSPIEIEVGRNTENIQTALTEFVDRYNAAIGFVNEQFRFDPETTSERPPLMGSATLTNIMSDLRSSLTRPVTGLDEESPFQTLFAIGIESGTNGTLSFNESDFADAIGENYEAVANLFRTSASFDETGVQLLGSPEGLDLSGRTADLVITQIAERASLTGSAIDIASGIKIDATNDTFKIFVDGMDSGDVSIANDTYTDGDELASAIAAAISSSVDLGELRVRVSYDSTTKAITIQSEGFGSEKTLQLSSSLSAFETALGFGSVMDTEFEGVDVAGTIDGEAAEGNGRILNAPEESELEGTSFLVTLTSLTGSLNTTATFSDGVGKVASRTLTSLTEAGTGTLTQVGQSIQRRIDDLTSDAERRIADLERYRERLQLRFARMEATLGSLQSQGQMLSAQIGASFSSLTG